MKLSEEDAQLFYRLMVPLQYYTNVRSGLIENVKSAQDFFFCSLTQKKKVRDYLFEHIEIIDDFIEDNAHQLDRNEIDIVLSWKHFVSGNFIIERLLNKYAVFIGGEKVYAVLALQDSFREILGNNPVPAYVTTNLLPFKGQIIYDGILEPFGLSFGSGIRGSMKGIYMNAKEQGTIIHDLLAAPPEENKGSAQKIRKELSKLIVELQELEQNLDTCELSATDANSIISLLNSTVQYAIGRFNAYDAGDYELAYKQFKKLKQALRKFENS
jgi:hypothetical protein